MHELLDNRFLTLISFARFISYVWSHSVPWPSICWADNWSLIWTTIFDYLDGEFDCFVDRIEIHSAAIAHVLPCEHHFHFRNGSRKIFHILLGRR